MSARFLGPLVLLIAPAATFAQEVKSDGEKLTPLQLSSKVSQALAQAKAAGKADPGRALLLLEEALIQIDEAEAVGEKQRAELRRRIRTVLQEISAAQASPPALPSAKGTDAAPARPAASPPSTGNVTGAAKSVIDERTRQLDVQNKLKQARAQAPGATASALQTSVKTSDAPIEFDKFWKELSALRAKTVGGNRLSPTEAALLKALETPLKVDFNKTPFRDVINYFAEKSGQPLTVSQATLDEAMVEYDTPVTLKVATSYPLRLILRKVLRERGLTYVVKDETLAIVTPEEARSMLVTRLYPVTERCGPQPPNDSLGYSANRNGHHLKRMIENMIEPEFWDVNGGGASVHYNWFNVSLTIRAPAEVHLRLGAAGFGFGK